jgi:hypothetical protein
MSRMRDVTEATPSLTPKHEQEVRDQLERVLNSHQFRASHRCQILLRYITEQTLAGATGSLKERTLGVEVFDRPADYDTGQDPVVRSTAAEIRKKLAQYYQVPEHASEPHIELHSGSYVALFHLNGADQEQERRRQPRRYFTILAGAAVVLLALTLVLAEAHRRSSPIDMLWSPMVSSPGTILISVGQPIAYNLKSPQAQDAIQGIGTPPPGFAEQSAIPKEDLVILADRYVALGDATCLVHLASVFERYGKPYRIRGERSISFADLRETPTVLVGAFDNQWTQRVAGQVRFFFVKDATGQSERVYDRQHPQNQKWKLTDSWPYWDVPNDYAIVSRIVDTTTDRPVVIAAGITQYGTMAAGEFLSNPRYFSEALPYLPTDWETKNLQIVLYVPVVNRVPGHARVLTAYAW